MIPFCPTRRLSETLAVAVWYVSLAAPSLPAAEPPPARPVLQALYTAVEPPLGTSTGETPWQNAPAADLQPMPEPGKPPPATAPRTTVQALWSRQAVYLRFTCADPHVLPAQGGRDADQFRGDAVEVFLDPAGNQRAWIELQVSPANALTDILSIATAPLDITPKGHVPYTQADREIWFLREWNYPGIRSETTATPEGWVATLSLPAAPLLKHLGATELRPMRLRANFIRFEHGPTSPDAVFLAWSPVLHGHPHISPAAMGELELLPPPAVTAP